MDDICKIRNLKNKFTNIKLNILKCDFSMFLLLSVILYDTNINKFKWESVSN